MLFSELGLSAELLRATDKQGYQEATPIQQQAIPLILEGRDLLAGAQTGTGKTAGFTLPLLQRLQNSEPQGHKRRVRALILVPTRELAAQVAESVRDYGRYLPFNSTVIFGGVSINPQISKLRNGVDIVIATPGRLLDHMQRGTIRLDAVETLVLDEADRMLDMGFIRDIEKVLQVMPRNRQNLLFSATFSKDIKQLANKLLNAPMEIQIARQNTTAEQISRWFTGRPQPQTRLAFAHARCRQLAASPGIPRTKHLANRLAQQLERDGLSAAAIHGNKSQGARTRALADFKKGAIRVLVATDIAARGLDIQQLPHVVNFELPNVPEDYIHRIGRTGRAGLEGEALSLVCIDEKKLLSDIERLLKQEIKKVVIPGYEPDVSIKAVPIKNGRNKQPSRGRRNNSSRNNRGRSANAQAQRGRNQGQRTRRAA